MNDLILADRVLTFAETATRVGRSARALYHLAEDSKRFRQMQLGALLYREGRLWRSTERRVANWIALRSGGASRRIAAEAAAAVRGPRRISGGGLS